MFGDFVGHVVFAVVVLALLAAAIMLLRLTAGGRRAGGTDRLLWLVGVLLATCFSLLLVFALGQMVQPHAT